MKHTTQKLAEIIARKCAVEICYKYGLNPEYQDNVETFIPSILSSTALVELLRLYKAVEHRLDSRMCDCHLNEPFELATAKLKSIIGEEI